MPFKLLNSSGTLQRTKDVILSNLQYHFPLVYLEDIVIFSKSPEEHIEHVCKDLSLLQNAGAAPILKKWTDYTDTIDYLGHAIWPKRLELASHSTDAIQEIKFLTSLTGRRSFLGLCNVNRRFLPNIARIVSPLNQQSIKPKPKLFALLSSEDLQAINRVQNSLMAPSKQALSYSSGHKTLYADAFLGQIGYVLLQKPPNNTIKPICSFSWSLFDT